MNPRPRHSLFRSRRFRRPGLLPVGVLCTLVTLHAVTAGADTSTNVIRFKAHVSNDRGVVRCGIFRENGWLKDAMQSAKVEIRAKVAWCIFNGLPAGTYGISGFHDENANGKLDTNFIGYPLEEYCASRNARNAFSAPSFSDAQFRYAGGTLDLEAVMK